MPYVSREERIERLATFYQGQQTREQVTALVDKFATDQVQVAVGYAAKLDGRGTYLGHSQNNRVVWRPELHNQQIAQARTARIEHYANIEGPVQIRALDVESVVIAGQSRTGGDLRDIAGYAEHIRSELTAATKTRPDATFLGGWGKDKVTTDVNEYIGWLTEALQQKSAAAE